MPDPDPFAYDVTEFHAGTTSAYDDIGAVINAIIADVKTRQTDQASKPGAVIYIPPGDYTLKTRVVVDISYVTIRGSGHGFTSLSIRYNAGDTSRWFEINAGGSHVRVANTDGHAEAFLVSRDGDPRLSSVQFDNFCLDGLSFDGNENSYRNGKIGIRAATPTDSLWIQNMGLVYLESAIQIYGADATQINNNMVAEDGRGIEFVGYGQASSVTANLIGVGPKGPSLAAEKFFGLTATSNNFFPRGRDDVDLKECRQCTVTANRFHAFYPGMVVLRDSSRENLIAANHFYREPEPFAPFVDVTNGRDDTFGLIRIDGDANAVSANQLSFNVPRSKIRPQGAKPVVVDVRSGSDNYIATNHVTSDVPVTAVSLGRSTRGTTVLDSATRPQFRSDTESFAFRPTPTR